jgi:hypothetical protein
VITKNHGEFNTGYRVWMLEAKSAVCEETITLIRTVWWMVEDAMAV